LADEKRASVRTKLKVRCDFGSEKQHNWIG